MALSPEQLREKLQDLNSLPTLPGVVRTVCGMVEDDRTNAQQLGETISRDQVLSAKVLRIVNSPFYGFPRRISSVQHAVVLLGFNVVKGLVLSATAFDDSRKDTVGLWEHSMATALLSRRIAKEIGLADPEETMVAGLLHDLGKIILLWLAPQDYDAARKVATVRGCHIAAAERAIFGVDHTQVAEWLAAQWQLPERLSQALVLHHAPHTVVDDDIGVAIVHVADLLARAMGYGNPGDRSLPPFHPGSYQRLGFTPKQLETLLMETEVEFCSGWELLRRWEPQR